jgi:hypothetical protein
MRHASRPPRGLWARLAAVLRWLFFHLLANLTHAVVGHFLLKWYENALHPPRYLGQAPQPVFGALDALPSIAQVRHLGCVEVLLAGCGFDLLQLAVGGAFPERLLIPLLSFDPFLLTCLDPASPVRFYREFTLAMLCIACIFAPGRLAFLAACVLVVVPIICHVEFLPLGILVVFRGLVCCTDPQQQDDPIITTWLMNIGCLAVGAGLFVRLMDSIGPIAAVTDVANRSVIKKLIETDTFGISPGFLLLVPVASLFNGIWRSTAPIYLMVLFALNLPFVSVEGEEYASVAVVRVLMHAGIAFAIAQQKSRTARVAIAGLAVVIGAAWYGLALRARALELVRLVRREYYGVE